MRIAVMGGVKNIKEINRLFKENVEISFFLDNNMQMAGKARAGKKVYSPYDFPQDGIEYIVILIYAYETVWQELTDLGVDASRIINFAEADLRLPEYNNIFNFDIADRLQLRLKVEYMDRKMKQLEDSYRHFEQNFIYEAADKTRNKKVLLPKIFSVKATCEKIISDKCSISRYGDGEFEIILGHAKDIYQGNDEKLAGRLREILASNLKNHIVAIADDYGAMEGLRKENKDTIRRYMTEEKRREHYGLLDMEKEYYNAYISRPYVIYPHNETDKAKARFEDLRRIWDKRDILFVEGNKTRMGVGNNLFENAESIQRIIAPNENAFDVYNDILSVALRYGKDKLILAALGPTATVLAYDLAKSGYWALDIGHLDLEYEWFLKGKGYSYVPHKYNNEMFGDTVVADIFDEDYDKSVIEIIK